MKPDPLPAEFVVYIQRIVLDRPHVPVQRIWRGLILKWGFWLDGVSANSLPGYAACPKPVQRTGLPAGWSYQKFHAICREAIGTPAIHAARARAAATRIDCGSGYDFGICPKCGKGHGHVLIANGKPSALVTNS